VVINSTFHPPTPYDFRTRRDLQVNLCLPELQCYTSRFCTMPWSRLWANKTQDPKLLRVRRHSTIDPTPSKPETAEDTENIQQEQAPVHSHNAPSPLRKSFEPDSVDNDNPTTEKAVVAAAQGPPQHRQRFSMLAKRHVSDPQISKTARVQRASDVPPMPSGE